MQTTQQQRPGKSQRARQKRRREEEEDDENPEEGMAVKDFGTQDLDKPREAIKRRKEMVELVASREAEKKKAAASGQKCWPARRWGSATVHGRLSRS